MENKNNLTIRKVDRYSLRKGYGICESMYRLHDDPIYDKNNNIGVSFWFNENFKENLMTMDDNSFIEYSRLILT